jgi:protoporphyrinogen IX oxidase
MLWIKALHIVFVASWFAGLLYLPRLFVNLTLVPADSTAERARLLLMARKLYRFTNLLSFPAVIFGLSLWLIYGIGRGGFGAGNGWLYVKLVVVFLAIGYTHSCGSLLKKLENGTSKRSHVWFRWYNEVPVILLLIAVILVVVKPF